MARYYQEWNFPTGSTGLPTGAVAGKLYYWLTTSAADACAAIATFNALTDAQAFAQSTESVPAAATATSQYTYAWQQTSCGSTPSSGASQDVDVVGDNSGYTALTTGGGGITNPSGSNDPATYNDYSSETSVRYYQ